MYEVYSDELFQLIDVEDFVRNEVETKGIVVIDEIDKLIRAPETSSSTKASDEGVQYDLLPILDGTTVSISQSKYFYSHSLTLLLEVKVNTKNILFVGAGAFEKVKPAELAIEVQGRMPIQAKMESLSKEDMISILTDTKHCLLKQSVELLKTEAVNIVFD